MTTTYVVPLRSTGTAYLWWFFLGGFGAHHFYLGRPGRGIMYFILCSLIPIALIAGALWLALLPVALLLWDLFTLPSQVRAVNAKLMKEYPLR